jgi:hypothetical protein
MNISFSVFSWYGFNNPNTCLFETSKSGGKEFGITLLPFQFWKHFGLNIDDWGHHGKRFYCGLGIISFHFDF